MGSIMLNNSGKIGLGYSISSSTVYPGIRYCGQSSSAYAAASGVLDLPETVIHSGTVAQTTYNRWGDYALLSVDPLDNETFWFTSEYVKTGGTTKGTKIASFKFGNAPAVTTLAATAVNSTSATLNGTVNPSGLATTYYFQYGTTTSYGSVTSTISAGSGASAVTVSANISGLITGQTYHFRLVATNTDGTSNGSDLTFVPGGAILTTTAVSSITMSTAVSGGTITTDGGSAITARGVCWSTTVNPVATGLHTTDGSGTGTFTSSITGLSSNTTYHVRAYATNANGTFYGQDIIFATSCGTITSFPWSEGFENAGSIPSCWSQEYVGSSVPI
ncbi:MAG: fibronectin type III domain-containing protein [Bacteroidales bacterium]|nr:fibronectin type III domain-containing protein [Bacteroidales bacterium]